MLAAGYAFQIETTQVAHLLGKRIEEIPFTFYERVAGESKMSLAISLEGIGVCLSCVAAAPLGADGQYARLH